MSIQLQFEPIGDTVEDKEIIVQGEVHNAREYMEQFQANDHKSFGMDSQHNLFFAPAKKAGFAIFYACLDLYF